jgi:hypothetical protein
MLRLLFVPSMNSLYAISGASETLNANDILAKRNGLCHLTRRYLRKSAHKLSRWYSVYGSTLSFGGISVSFFDDKGNNWSIKVLILLCRLYQNWELAGKQTLKGSDDGVTLRITGFMHFVRRPEFWRTRRFGNWMFPSSGEWRETPALLRPSGGDNPSHWFSD